MGNMDIQSNKKEKDLTVFKKHNPETEFLKND